MSEKSTDPYRISFAKDKVGNFPKGITGITGTSQKSVDPTGEIEAKVRDEGYVDYNASELLFKNLDALGEKLNFSSSNDVSHDNSGLQEENQQDGEIVSGDWGADMLDDLSEEDVIKNLKQHLGYPSGIRVNTGADLTSTENSFTSSEVNYMRVAANPNNPYNAQDADILSKIMQQSPQYVRGENNCMEFKNDLFCRNCGGKYTSVDNFCGACGFKRA
jgi:hypothetical protein